MDATHAKIQIWTTVSLKHGAYMYWKLLFGSLVTLTLAGTVTAMAQNNGGSIHTNKNTTNSLAGVNNRTGPVVNRAPAIRTHVGRKNGNANTTNSLTGAN